MTDDERLARQKGTNPLTEADVQAAALVERMWAAWMEDFLTTHRMVYDQPVSGRPLGCHCGDDLSTYGYGSIPRYGALDRHRGALFARTVTLVGMLAPEQALPSKVEEVKARHRVLDSLRARWERGDD